MFLLDWPHLTVTPAWTRTLGNGFIRPASPNRRLVRMGDDLSEDAGPFQ